jgi:dTMP kinase
MTSPAGRFIVVEGPDGAGKSTLVTELSVRMDSLGHLVVPVREPGGTPAAEALRRELLDRSRRFEPLTELLYITAARADLVHHVIRPALVAGKTVIADRFDLSTRAYQVAGRGIEPNVAELFNRAATGGLEPDLTLVIDLPVNVGMERQVASGKHQDRMDLESGEFQSRVAAAYLATEGRSVRHLDGAQTREQVIETAWRAIVETWPDIFSISGANTGS